MPDSVRDAISHNLRTYLSSTRLHLPIDSDELLRSILGSVPFVPGRQTLRLTDTAAFEALLESFAQSWEFGSLSVVRDESGCLSLIDAHVVPESLKKRKRSEDDEENIATTPGTKYFTCQNVF